MLSGLWQRWGGETNFGILHNENRVASTGYNMLWKYRALRCIAVLCGWRVSSRPKEVTLCEADKS